MAVTITDNGYQYEPGYSGTMFSLGGRTSEGDKGRRRHIIVVNLSAASDSAIVLPPNQNRIAASVYNLSGGGTGLITLGKTASGTCFWAAIATGGYAQIDYRYPWTGPIGVYVNNPCLLAFTEVDFVS